MIFWMPEQLEHDGVFVDVHDRRTLQRLPNLGQAVVQKFIVVDNRAIVICHAAILIQSVAAMWKLD